MKIRAHQTQRHTTVVPTDHLRQLQTSNQALRRMLVEKQNEVLSKECQAAQVRQLLAGALSIMLWWPIRTLVRLTEGRIRKNFDLPYDFARKAAEVLHYEEQRRQRVAASRSTSSSRGERNVDDAEALEAGEDAGAAEEDREG